MRQPKMHRQSIRRLSVVAKKLDMPMTKLLNLIVTTALEELEPLEVDDAIGYVPVRPEEPQREPQHAIVPCAATEEGTMPQPSARACELEGLLGDCVFALEVLLTSPDLTLDNLEQATREAIAVARETLDAVHAVLPMGR